MENNRRRLRNKSNCHQITNIFNTKASPTCEMSHLPPSIVAKLGKLQKITCFNIQDLPELHPNQQFQHELQNCRQAQNMQNLAINQLQVQPTLKLEQPMESQLILQTVLKHGMITQEDIQPRSCEGKDWRSQWMEDESRGVDIWKDAQFLCKLNDLLMFGCHNNRLSMEDQLFQK